MVEKPEVNNVLGGGPVDSCRAEKCTSALMVKAAIEFDIASEGRVKMLASGSNPVEDGAL